MQGLRPTKDVVLFLFLFAFCVNIDLQDIYRKKEKRQEKQGAAEEKNK